MINIMYIIVYCHIQEGMTSRTSALCCQRTLSKENHLYIRFTTVT